MEKRPKITQAEIEARARKLWDDKRLERGLPPAPLPDSRKDFRLYALGQLLSEAFGFDPRPMP